MPNFLAQKSASLTYYETDLPKSYGPIIVRPIQWLVWFHQIGNN